MISVPAVLSLPANWLLSQPGRRGHPLILLLLCFLLFTVIEKIPGEMLKLTDITWLYHHLPMRFS